MRSLAKHQVCLIVLWAVSIVVGWRVLVDTLALSLRDEAYTHILLILPISAALILMEWRFLRTMVATSVRSGCAFLAVAILVSCVALVWSVSLPADLQLSIRMFALVLWWVGAFVTCLGPHASRTVSFPLFLLFGLVPFPQAVLSWIVALLQQGSAWSAHMLFAACGVPVSQDGVQLTIPGLTLQVAQECSSIRSSSMLLVTTMVLAQLLLRSPWRKALVIALAVPLSVAKNGLRVFTIAMLGTRVDREFLTGPFHHQGGILFFAIALVIIFLLLWILRRGDDLPTLGAESVKDAVAKTE